MIELNSNSKTAIDILLESLTVNAGEICPMDIYEIIDYIQEKELQSYAKIDRSVLIHGFEWKTRYSDTEESDKHGRWARLCFYNGLLIAWVSRIDHYNTGRIYSVHDFFPTTSNDMPEYCGTDNNFENIKKGIQERFNCFISKILEQN